MEKALLGSILLATALIPLYAARAPTTRKAVRVTWIAIALFCVVYAVGLAVVYPQIHAEPK